MTVVEVLGADERSRVCERVLRALPHWFGIERANQHYIEAVKELETHARPRST